MSVNSQLDDGCIQLILVVLAERWWSCWCCTVHGTAVLTKR